MDTDTIRVGVVGAGWNTKGRHIPLLQGIAGVEVVSVCNRGHASSQQVAEEFGIPNVYDNWWELVADEDTNAIVIGTWPYFHHRVTLAALAAGKHVMCEARMAMDASEAHEMLRASRAMPHLTAQLVPSPFTLGIDRTVQRLIRERYLGELFAAEVRQQGDYVDWDAPMNWRYDRDLSGYNVMGMGIWYEALMRWVGEATRVMAMGKIFVKMRYDPTSQSMRPVYIPEHLDVIADLACGAQAHMGMSRVAGLQKGVHMSLFGSEGTLHFSDDTLYGRQRGDETLHEINIPPEDQGGWRVEEEFVNAIRGTETITHTSFADGVKYMEFTEAVARSMVEERAISLPMDMTA